MDGHDIGIDCPKEEMIKLPNGIKPHQFVKVVNSSNWLSLMQEDIERRLEKTKGKAVLSKCEKTTLKGLHEEIYTAIAILKEYNHTVQYRVYVIPTKPSESILGAMTPQDVKKHSADCQ